jgi:RHS repeat-associated protein
MVNYDKRGNISSLTRNTFDDINGALQIDNLTYTYNSASNQLSKIADASNNAQGFNINGALSSAAYTYDLNGSLRTDPYKKITSINYYYNNLPKEIVFNFGVSNINRIRFTYDAMGTKLRKQVLNNSGTVTAQQDYVDGIDYNNNAIEAIYHNAGRAVWNGSTWRYEFNVTDHLGNVRAVISDLNSDKILNFTNNATTHEIINSFAQYPFGMAMANDGAFNNTLTPDTKYRYNGKELNEDLGLNMYLSRAKERDDYGARFYDPSVGRFTTVDPLAEKMPSWSPYNYTFNNPLRFIDPDGQEPEPPGWLAQIKQSVTDAGSRIKNYFNVQNLVSGNESQKFESIGKMNQVANASKEITNNIYDAIDSGAECVGNACDLVQDAALATALSEGTTTPVTGPIAGGAEVLGNLALGMQIGTDYARDGKIDKTGSQIVVKVVTGTAGKYLDDKISSIKNLGKTGDQTKASVKAVSNGVLNTTEKVINKKIDENKSSSGTWWGGGAKY